MRGSIIILILFFSAERSIAKQVSEEGKYDTIPRQNIPFHRCATNEQPAKIDLKEWISYLERVLVLDSVSLDTIPEGCYQVVVQFVIDKEGKIIDVKILEDPGFGLGKRAANFISEYTGRWQPAMQNGRLVKAFRKQTITFMVEKDEEEKEECKKTLFSELIL